MNSRPKVSKSSALNLMSNARFLRITQVLDLARLPKLCPRTKHIQVCYHHFCEHVRKGLIKIFPIDTKDQIADQLRMTLYIIASSCMASNLSKYQCEGVLHNQTQVQQSIKVHWLLIQPTYLQLGYLQGQSCFKTISMTNTVELVLFAEEILGKIQETLRFSQKLALSIDAYILGQNNLIN